MQFVSKKKWFLKRFSERSTNIKLGFRNLYIFPNKFGIYWIFACTLIYILGSSLEANITISISSLMAMIFILNLFLTHFNLHGLEINSISQGINFAKSPIKYKVILKSKILRTNLIIKFLNDESEPVKIEKIEGVIAKFIYSTNKQRGIFSPEIIYGKSSAPMSLFNCWFYWRPLENIIVAPKSISYPENNIHKDLDGTKNLNSNIFGDEISYLKNYRKGENKSQIDWKSFAKTNKLSSKKFIGKSSNIKFLKLNRLYPLEKSLQYLCFEIKEAYKKGDIYGVEIKGDLHINPSSGYEHYRSCLILLAGYKE